QREEEAAGVVHCPQSQEQERPDDRDGDRPRQADAFGDGRFRMMTLDCLAHGSDSQSSAARHLSQRCTICRARRNPSSATMATVPISDPGGTPSSPGGGPAMTGPGGGGGGGRRRRPVASRATACTINISTRKRAAIATSAQTVPILPASQTVKAAT